MSTRERRPDPSPTRSAWAISLSVHGLGFATMVAFGAAHATHAAWSASASTPTFVALRPDPLLEVELPVEPAAIPVVDAVAEEAPPETAFASIDALPAAEPASESGDEVADVAAAAPPPAPTQRVDWLAAIRRVPVPGQASVDASGANVEASPQHGENEPPDYPFVAFRRGIEGEVMVLLEIDESGVVTAAHVERSSGSSQLDDAALQKLATWRFEPARRAGRAVRGTWRQAVVFRITN